MYGIAFINTYLDTNECDAYFGVCSQYCKNTVGNYSCFCAPGFVESPSHGCKASGKNNQLLWSVYTCIPMYHQYIIGIFSVYCTCIISIIIIYMYIT